MEAVDKKFLRRFLIVELILIVALIITAIVLYAAGVPWVVSGLDAFWTWFDGSVERLKVLAALLPLAVVYVAYRVYKADRWWKRAEWALDASLDESEDKRHMGNRFTVLLAESRMAPKDDLRMWNELRVEEREESLLDIWNRDEPLQ